MRGEKGVLVITVPRPTNAFGTADDDVRGKGSAGAVGTRGGGTEVGVEGTVAIGTSAMSKYIFSRRSKVLKGRWEVG